MRDIFVDEFISLVKKNPKIILITADLGFGSFDEISKKFPNNFLNVGVAEQNMIGVAAGMAMLGRIPFCYSIGNFATLRCLEQIRNDAAYHKLPITIVSNGAGFIVVLTGKMMLMPGMPKKSAVQRIDIDSKGRITGLS